nr:hypothetical protein [uncultured Oscillibacter sp.]
MAVGKDEVGGSNPPSSSMKIFPEPLWFWGFLFLRFFVKYMGALGKSLRSRGEIGKLGGSLFLASFLLFLFFYF